MFSLKRLGRLFFSIGIISYGVQQIIIRDFRPQILPDFPSWAHTIKFFPVISGFIMIAIGLVLTGIGKISVALRRKLALYLGVYFLFLILSGHMPYLLFVYPHKLIHLGSWGDLLKALAFSGASFIMAGSYPGRDRDSMYKTGYESKFDPLIPLGRFFYCTTIILFGCDHFLYDISFMVPKWMIWQSFWSHFGGAALICAGSAIVIGFFPRVVALLLALMLLLWFFIVHLPGAVAHPYLYRGNSIVSAFDALLFSGTALLISEGCVHERT